MEKAGQGYSPYKQDDKILDAIERFQCGSSNTKHD